MNVSDIQYTNLVGTIKTPEHFYVDIEPKVQGYINKRFISADGSSDYILKFELEELSVNYEQVASKNDVAKFVNVAKHDRYTVSMGLHIIYEDLLTGSLKGQRVKGTRVMNVLEHVSINERENHQAVGVESLFADIDAAVIETLRDEFGIVAF